MINHYLSQYLRLLINKLLLSSSSWLPHLVLLQLSQLLWLQLLLSRLLADLDLSAGLARDSEAGVLGESGGGEGVGGELDYPGDGSSWERLSGEGDSDRGRAWERSVRCGQGD